MNLEKVIFGFSSSWAMTLNFGFVFGDVADPNHHVYRRCSPPSW